MVLDMEKHSYKDKFQLEYFKVVSGCFFLDHSKPRYKKQFWNYHSLILGKQSFQLSTNGIESINFPEVEGNFENFFS